MEKWKKDRNYKVNKIKNDNGEVIRNEYFIIVNGAAVEVSKSVYKAYSQADRRERYCRERDAGRLLSIEQFETDGISLESLLGEYAESAEASVICATLSDKVSSAFILLEPDERKLIQAIVINGVTERDYSAHIGISQTGVNKRKQIILEKLKNLVLKS